MVGGAVEDVCERHTSATAGPPNKFSKDPSRQAKAALYFYAVLWL